MEFIFILALSLLASMEFVGSKRLEEEDGWKEEGRGFFSKWVYAVWALSNRFSNKHYPSGPSLFFLSFYICFISNITQVLQYNHESLEEKIAYLLEEMGREVRELLAFPAFLGYKLDSRIKHRYEVKREILGEGMSLNKLLSESAERFKMKEEKKKKQKKMVVLIQQQPPPCE